MRSARDRPRVRVASSSPLRRPRSTTRRRASRASARGSPSRSPATRATQQRAEDSAAASSGSRVSQVQVVKLEQRRVARCPQYAMNPDDLIVAWNNMLTTRRAGRLEVLHLGRTEIASDLLPEVAMKLYDSQMAPNPRRVRIFLAEKGVDACRPSRSTSRRPRTASRRILAKNPLGGVPGARARRRHVPRRDRRDLPLLRGAAARSRRCCGTDAKDRAVVEMWQRRMELEVLLTDQPAPSATRTTSSRAASRRCRSTATVCKRAARSASSGSTASSRSAAVRRRRRATRSPTSPRSAASTSAASIEIRIAARAEAPGALARGGVVAAEREGLTGGRMRTRRLGRTGLVVPEICLGTMTFGAWPTRRRASRSSTWPSTPASTSSTSPRSIRCRPMPKWAGAQRGDRAPSGWPADRATR